MIDLNKAMYDVLIIGMISSTVLYVLGLVLFFVQNALLAETKLIHYASVSQFFQQLLVLRSSAVLTLATMILLATPIMRVFISILVFTVNRDRKFVLITATVLIILLTSIALGYLGHFTPS